MAYHTKKNLAWFALLLETTHYHHYSPRHITYSAEPRVGSDVAGSDISRVWNKADHLPARPATARLHVCHRDRTQRRDPDIKHPGLNPKLHDARQSGILILYCSKCCYGGTYIKAQYTTVRAVSCSRMNLSLCGINAATGAAAG
ncbi:hypothetical protein CEXT_639981 [Caerostris extrusa]|uniref:Uncharacterized protein n=1 Tax=Caerostris extrusa TaxID=172846 RepID=A0AAV4QNP6_CAEEX|nr:hypothetical protein CEXT_639981 [Caerostris extrusa]